MRKRHRGFNGGVPSRAALAEQIATAEREIQNGRQAVKDLAKALEEKACEMARLSTENWELRDEREAMCVRVKTGERLVGQLMNANLTLVRLLGEARVNVSPTKDGGCRKE